MAVIVTASVAKVTERVVAATKFVACVDKGSRCGGGDGKGDRRGVADSNQGCGNGG